jgi:hypothetical protein
VISFKVIDLFRKGKELRRGIGKIPPWFFGKIAEIRVKT